MQVEHTFNEKKDPRGEGGGDYKKKKMQTTCIVAVTGLKEARRMDTSSSSVGLLEQKLNP